MVISVREIFDRETEGSIQDTLKLFTWESPDKQLVLELPEGFAQLEAEKREESYPSSDRPEIILENVQGKAQLTLKFFRKVMKKEDTGDVIREIRKLTENTYVQYPNTPSYLYANSEIPVGWFLMYMKDIKKEHIKAVFSINRQMVLLTLTYLEKENWKWRTVRDYIFASIKEGIV